MSNRETEEDLRRQLEEARLQAGLRLRSTVESLPLDTPREMFEQLEALGYVGQEEGRRSLCLLAHRHVRRLRYLVLDRVPRERLPPKENHLLVGPTGCGKTFMVELLFQKILKLPTALVDVTTFSETGYVGNDVSTVLTRLLYAADGDPFLAQLGIVCLDEFDKIASGQNKALFAGAGTTKDVSGMGVQRELLKLLERGRVPVPTTFEHNTYQQRLMMDTDDIVFVACGAFSGLKSLSIQQGGANKIGYQRPEPRVPGESIAVGYDPDELEDTSIFQRYGFLPELIGRFTRILPFQPLDEGTLRRILAEQVLPARVREMELAGILLEVQDQVIRHLVDRALRKETGARGLAAALTRHLERAAFDAYSEEGVKGLRLCMQGDQICSSLS